MRLTSRWRTIWIWRSPVTTRRLRIRICSALKLAELFVASTPASCWELPGVESEVTVRERPERARVARRAVPVAQAQVPQDWCGPPWASELQWDLGTSP